MDSVQSIDLAILVLAGLFLLVGLIYFFRGLVGRDPSSLYGVQRQSARRSAFVQLLQGVGLLMVAGALFSVYLGFQNQSVAVVEPPAPTVAPTLPVAVVEPTAEPTPLPTNTSEPPTPVIAVVETLTPTLETVTLEPTATLEPTQEPTATPLPYDATVSVIGGLNMRDAPNGNLLLLLEDGTPVNLLEGRESAGAFMWQQVETLEGDAGWVVEEFLILTE